MKKAIILITLIASSFICSAQATIKNDSIQFDTIRDTKFETLKMYVYTSFQEVQKIAAEEKKLTGNISNLKTLQSIFEQLDAILKENENEFTIIVKDEK